MGDLIKEIPVKDRYEVVDIKLVHENTWNPNVQQAENFDALKRDIERVDGNYQQPLLVRPHPELKGEYEIIDGAHRYRAMRDLGFDEIVVVVENLDDKMARIKTISMNKLRGDFDTVPLATLMVELQKVYGMTEEELKDLLGYSEDEIKGFESLISFEPSSFDDTTAPEGDEDLSGVADDMVLNVTPAQRAAIEKLPGLMDTKHLEDALALAALYLEREKEAGTLDVSANNELYEKLQTPVNPEEEAMTEQMPQDLKF